VQIEVALRPQQLEVFDNMKRFNVLLAHRRLGKTWFAVWVLIMKVLTCPLPNARGAYYAPTFSQAKRISWDYAKAFCAQIPGAVFNEAELRIDIGDKRIQLGSADNPDSSRGIYLDFAVLDEPANMPARMWSEVLRPALSDRNGGALFIGTPQGRFGLLYDSYNLAENDPDWARWAFRADETGIIPDEELRALQRSMSKAEYEQEMLISWDAAIRGAYWADAMQRTTIGTYAPLPGKRVHLALDLGMNDATAVWFFQLDGNVPIFINYVEFSNMGLPDIVADWRARPYLYGKVICPHDINVRSLSTGQTRLETLRALGCDVVVAPKVDVMDGIEAVRQMLPRARFDKEACIHGIEALRQYRADWEDKKGVLMLRPRHDRFSHAADAMRYFAVSGIETLGDSWSNLDYTPMRQIACA
jgi:hypothetical protein